MTKIKKQKRNNDNNAPHSSVADSIRTSPFLTSLLKNECFNDEHQSQIASLTAERDTAIAHNLRNEIIYQNDIDSIVTQHEQNKKIIAHALANEDEYRQSLNTHYQTIVSKVCTKYRQLKRKYDKLVIENNLPPDSDTEPTPPSSPTLGPIVFLNQSPPNSPTHFSRQSSFVERTATNSSSTSFLKI